MNPRKRNWLIAAGGMLVLWLIHPFYVRNLESFMEKRGWHQVLNNLLAGESGGLAEMDDYFGTLFSNLSFWLGAALVLGAWGALELWTARRRRIRRNRNPLLEHGDRIMSAYVRFKPETGTLENSHNVASVTDNGTGDFTITFIDSIRESHLTVLPLYDSIKPSKITPNVSNARVDSVRVIYKKEPDIVGLLFES